MHELKRAFCPVKCDLLVHAISVLRCKTSLTFSENSFLSPFSLLLYSSHHSRNVGEIPAAAWLDLNVQHWKEGRASDVFHLFFSFFCCFFSDPVPCAAELFKEK